MWPADGPVPIAFCVTDLDRGGAEQALVRLVTGLDRQRWAPVVYCLSQRGELADELQEVGIPVVCLQAAGWWSVPVLARLVRHLRRQRPVILQTYLYHANIAGRIAARLAGIGHVVSGLRVAEKRSRFRLWLDRATESLVEKHVCVSRAVADFSVREGGLSAEKVVVIPNGVDAERFADAEPADLAEFGIPADARTLLFVGRLDYQKGPDLLLEAMRLLGETHNDLHLLLVGDGPMRTELQLAAGSYDLDARVHFAGRRDDVPRLMKAACLLVLPSRWEGLPNVVLEAMAAGLPVVAAEVEGVAELLEDGRTGRLVSPEDSRGLAEAITGLLKSAADARNLEQSAQHVVHEEFTWDKSVERHARLYEGLLRNCR